jgi:hypothetical protein
LPRSVFCPAHVAHWPRRVALLEFFLVALGLAFPLNFIRFGWGALPAVVSPRLAHPPVKPSLPSLTGPVTGSRAHRFGFLLLGQARCHRWILSRVVRCQSLFPLLINSAPSAQLCCPQVLCSSPAIWLHLWYALFSYSRSALPAWPLRMASQLPPVSRRAPVCSLFDPRVWLTEFDFVAAFFDLCFACSGVCCCDSLRV